MTTEPPTGERPGPTSGIDLDGLRQGTATAPRPTTPRWEPIAATTIGSVHVRDQLPIQDATLTWADGPRSVIAVSDGHGHKDHFRSDTGAALAVVSAVEIVRHSFDVVAETVESGWDPIALDLRAREIAAGIIEAWATKVHQHIAAHPFGPEESPSDPLRPYGATLIVAAVIAEVVLLLQVGDGDAVVVAADGYVSRPLPDDPRHEGNRTGSLCEPDPLVALRAATFPTNPEASAPLALVYICTDGFSTSRVDRDWWRQTGEQLLDFNRDHGTDWIRSQLPEWLTEPALVGGDDTTLALLVRA